jgi:hypothetical protein
MTVHLTPEQMSGIVGSLINALDIERGGIKISLGVKNTPATLWYGGPDNSNVDDGQKLAFTALPNSTTQYQFVIPFDCSLQGGWYFAKNAGDLDEISFGITTLDENGNPTIWWYLQNIPVSQNEKIYIFDNYSTSEKIPANTPLYVRYKNTTSANIIVRFALILKL